MSELVLPDLDDPRWYITDGGLGDLAVFMLVQLGYCRFGGNDDLAFVAEQRVDEWMPDGWWDATPAPEWKLLAPFRGGT